MGEGKGGEKRSRRGRKWGSASAVGPGCRPDCPGVSRPLLRGSGQVLGGCPGVDLPGSHRAKGTANGEVEEAAIKITLKNILKLEEHGVRSRSRNACGTRAPQQCRPVWEGGLAMFPSPGSCLPGIGPRG